MKLSEITGIKDTGLLVEYLNANGIFNFPSATLNPDAILDEIDRKTSSYIALTKYVIHLIFTNEEKRNAVFAELGLSPLKAQEKYNCKHHNIFTPEYWYAAKYYKLTDTMKLSDVVLSDKEYKALEDLNNCCQIADLFDPNLTIGDIRELIDIIGLATPNDKRVSNDIETLKDLANYHNYGRKYPFNLIRDAFCYRLDQNCARNIIKIGPEILTQMIEESLKKLSHERDAEFIYKLYKDGMTMTEIGNETDITKERVREIICRGLRQLRHPSRSKMILPLLSLETDDIGFIAIKKFISNPDTKGSKILNIITDNKPSSAYELISTNNFIKHLILQGDDILSIMTSINIELTNNDIEEYDVMVDNEKRNALETSIEDLDLSVRSFNCLKRAGIKTVQDILSLINKEETPFDALWKVRNLGRRGSIEVLEKLVEIRVLSPNVLTPEI